MPRKKKAPIEASAYAAVEAEIEEQLKGMPLDRDLTDAETTSHFKKNRKYILARLIALSKFSPDPEEKKWALQELLSQDIGKAGTRKKSDGDDVGSVLMKPGEMGIPPTPCPHCGKMIGI